ncbi:XtmB Phage terminase large subunit [uncultured Caudovirales phage]|jgi:phage terminase large subunit|uniref:XtmB Phage terminase large subunit n=1 Tax=uncultured Caudovirales phage TaxID=2100421 RepID=A0A6J5LK47_9CAUD|nr:XtmB Phage terminase large subunit [uncultured Caudovirales phage]
MDLKSTVVFEKNYDALYNNEARFIINEGGSRSSKTYSLCQLILVYCLQNKGVVVSIIRKTFPALRATAMRDFLEVLKESGIYEKTSHNMSEHIYSFNNGSIVEFFSVDDEQKIRGRKRHLAWCNEANELYYDDFTQLNMRTESKMIFDYNPSESNSWLYDLPKNESILIKSTYKDNPFLPESIKIQIEDLKRTDEAHYQIYALGEKAISKSNIYSNWTFLPHRPARFTQFIYGIDFGYNHPTALVRIYWHEKDIFIEPVIYESYLTTSDLLDRFEQLGIEKNADIIADYARPEIIAELNNNGYNVINANKAVKKGIDNVKTFGIFCMENEAVKKEYQNYKWKKIGDQITDEPVKLWDDAMDATRYAVAYIKEQYFTDDAYYAF